MASSSSDPTAEAEIGSKSNRKKLPESIDSLLDVAIFSFGCQAGLRSNHKVRGDPIIEGVCAFFGRLLRYANPQTVDEFDKVSSPRLGGWKPGNGPSKEISTLISSRLKTLKSRGAIRENADPEVPHLLQEKKHKFLTEEDRVQTRVFARCWRCGVHCQFCRSKKKIFPKFGDFRVDIASPFLGILEDILEDRQADQDLDQPSDNDDDGSQEEINDEDDDVNFKKCLSEIDFSDEDEEDLTYGETRNEDQAQEAEEKESFDSSCEED